MRGLRQRWRERREDPDQIREPWQEVWESWDARSFLQDCGDALLGLISPIRWWEFLRRCWHWWGFPTTWEDLNPSLFVSNWRARWDEQREEAPPVPRPRVNPFSLVLLAAVAASTWLVFSLPTRSRLHPPGSRVQRPTLPGTRPESARKPADHARLGLRYLKEDYLSDAAGEFIAALEHDETNIEALLGMSRVATRMRQPVAAVKFARAAARRTPDSADALNTLGIAQAEAGKLREAARTFSRALRLKPDRLDVLFNAATCRAREGDWKGAEAYARQALALAPDRAPLRIVLGSILFRQGRTAEGVAELESVVRTEPDNAVAQHLLARASMAQGRSAEALKALKQVQLLRPEWPVPHLDAGIAALQQGSLAEARESFEEALRRNPRLPSGWLGKAEVARMEGRVEDAVSCYEHVLEIDPNLVMALNNLAYLYAGLGRKLDRAREMARRVAAVQPLSGTAWDTLGWVEFRAGKSTEAIAALRQSVRFSPQRGIVHYHLAQALLAETDGKGPTEDQRAEAEKHLRLALTHGLPEQETGEAKQALGKIAR